MRICVPVVLVLAAILGAPLCAAPTFSVPQEGLPDPLVLITYGDIRFTPSSETAASSPHARRALIARIAAENPAAVFINGDVPWHGIDTDYQVYRGETRRWQARHLRIYPALGNHEFSACEASMCLERWWNTFAQLRGRRWYSVAIGDKVVGIALDSDASLLPGSDQRLWLEAEIASLDPKVRVVLIVMHHPPVADVQTTGLTDHNPRANEQSLAAYLKTAAPGTAARFVVSAGHIHNYERFAQDGITYLVSGGGGAAPYEVQRTPSDLYRNADFPNYHFVRLTVRSQSLSGEMIRLSDYAAARPGVWRTMDSFEINLPP